MDVDLKIKIVQIAAAVIFLQRIVHFCYGFPGSSSAAAAEILLSWLERIAEDMCGDGKVMIVIVQTIARQTNVKTLHRILLQGCCIKYSVYGGPSNGWRRTCHQTLYFVMYITSHPQLGGSCTGTPSLFFCPLLAVKILTTLSTSSLFR